MAKKSEEAVDTGEALCVVHTSWLMRSVESRVLVTVSRYESSEMKADARSEEMSEEELIMKSLARARNLRAMNLIR
jgi:hypothetical protein